MRYLLIAFLLLTTTAFAKEKIDDKTYEISVNGIFVNNLIYLWRYKIIKLAVFF
jgi:hypothetical protein